MKKLESLKNEKFTNLENYKVSNLAAIVGGRVQPTDQGGPITDYSYDQPGQSDGCHTKVKDGDTSAGRTRDSECYQ